MKVKPILTEKSLKLSKEGWYSFETPSSLTKGKIKRKIEEIFEVHVRKVRTISIQGRSKAIVKLADGEKIDLFEEKPKGSKAK